MSSPFAGGGARWAPAPRRELRFVLGRPSRVRRQLRDALRERNEQLRTAAEALAQLRKDFDFNLEARVARPPGRRDGALFPAATILPSDAQVVRARDREIAALDEEVQELRSDMQANARLLSEARLAVSHADAQLW